MQGAALAQQAGVGHVREERACFVAGWVDTEVGCPNAKD
jgi:hypothetical protein